MGGKKRTQPRCHLCKIHADGVKKKWGWRRACASACVHARLCVPLRMQALWKRRKVSKCRDCSAVVELFSIWNESRNVSLSQHEWNPPPRPFIWRFSELEGTKKAEMYSHVRVTVHACIWTFVVRLRVRTRTPLRTSLDKKGGKPRENGGQVPKGILCACVCVHACVFLFCSYSVLSHGWAGHADRNRVLGGPATGAPQGTHWACSEKYRKGMSCCDRTEPGTLVTQRFMSPGFFLCLWRVRHLLRLFLLLHSCRCRLPRTIHVLWSAWTASSL